MGASCGSDMKRHPDTAFPSIKTEDSSQSLNSSDEIKSKVSRPLSTSSSVMKNFFFWRNNSPSTTLDDEEIDDWDKEGDENLEQLWEDCYDLSEQIERTCLSVLRYQQDLMDKGYKCKQEQRCITLMTIFVNGMKKNDFKEVVTGLCAALFSSDNEQYDDLLSEQWLEITRRLGRDLTKTMIESFELFLMPGRMNNEFLIKATSHLWSEIFKIHSEVEKIGKKFLNLFGDKISNSNDDDLWRVLNHLLKLVQRKQHENPERARKLLDRISELRNALE